MYIFEYVMEKVGPRLLDRHFFEITDYFELLAYAADKKPVSSPVFPFLWSSVSGHFLHPGRTYRKI